MKKYFVLAAAALVALTACTKMEVANTPDTAKKISFEVANYMAQTKANETGLVAEGFNSFHTNAWYHSVADGTQYFMNNVAILWNTAPNTNLWAPAVDYYWPKTGYVNFYSYAGTQDPTTVDTEGSLVYTDKVIAYDDNILVADASYGLTSNLSTYQIENSTLTGVPTLFRHYLAKLKFNVKLATTEAKKSANNRFKVEILDAYVKVANKGTLTLSNADPVSSRSTAAPGTPGTAEWTNANSSYANVAWVPATWSETEGSETVEKIHLVTTDPVAGRDMVQRTLNLGLNKTTQTETGDNLVLLAERTVMPQHLVDNQQVFYIKYKVYAYHDTNDTDDNETAYSVETIEFTGNLSDFIASASRITEWNKNTKYTYNVIIDPIASKITFDPAVETWAPEVTQDFNPWLN